MSDHGHDLNHEFPEDRATLHALKENGGHFLTLADRYHTLAKEIHLIETGIEPTSDQHLETLKKERLSLLDAVAQMIEDKKASA